MPVVRLPEPTIRHLGSANLRALVRSQEYQSLTGAEREKVLQRFAAQPRERQQEILAQLRPATRGPGSTVTDAVMGMVRENLGPVENPPSTGEALKEGGKFGLATALDVGLQQGGATLGMLAGSRIGAPLLGRALGETGGSGLAQYLNTRVLGLREPSTAGDILSVGAPLAVRGVEGAIRLWPGTVGRGAQAFREAERLDEENLMRFNQDYRRAAEQQFEGAQEAARRTDEALEARNQALIDYDVKAAGAQRKADLANEVAEAKFRTANDTRKAIVQQHQQATQTLENLPASFKPQTPSGKLYQLVAQHNPEVPLDSARQTAQYVLDVIERDLPTLREGRIARLARDIRDYGIAEGDEAAEVVQPAFREIQTWLSSVGKFQGQLDDAERAARGAWLVKTLRKGIAEDLVAAEGNPAVSAASSALKEANKAFRKEVALDDLAEAIQRGIRVGDDQLVRVSPGRILNAFDDLVRTDRLFPGSFDPGELQRIRADLAAATKLERIPQPARPPTPVRPRLPNVPRQAMEAPQTFEPPQVQFPEPPTPVAPTVEAPGFQDYRRMAVLGGLVGGGVGSQLGGYFPGLATGMTAGAGAVGLDYLLAQALVHPKGRNLARRIISGQLALRPGTLTGLTAALKAIVAPEESAQ